MAWGFLRTIASDCVFPERTDITTATKTPAMITISSKTTGARGEGNNDEVMVMLRFERDRRATADATIHLSGKDYSPCRGYTHRPSSQIFQGSSFQVTAKRLA